MAASFCVLVADARWIVADHIGRISVVQEAHRARVLPAEAFLHTTCVSISIQCASGTLTVDFLRIVHCGEVGRAYQITAKGCLLAAPCHISLCADHVRAVALMSVLLVHQTMRARKAVTLALLGAADMRLGRAAVGIMAPNGVSIWSANLSDRTVEAAAHELLCTTLVEVGHVCADAAFAGDVCSSSLVHVANRAGVAVALGRLVAAAILISLCAHFTVAGHVRGLLDLHVARWATVVGAVRLSGAAH
mmetsp:Transcript_6871/g.15002  ORF Transcript_6871/g.15002 Transcript_6871/m.15002 type:complete len:248 (+) Transcript_6871:1292-2035(+)